MFVNIPPKFENLIVNKLGEVMKFVIVALIVSLSLNAAAQDRYMCEHSGATRVIEVVYTAPDGPLPCEVRYTKNGETKIVWSAENEIGYCEDKAKTFAQKQESFGWSCSESNVPNTSGPVSAPAASTP